MGAPLKGIPQVSILGHSLFNIFMNDLFYFIETYSLTNYANDNTLDMISSKIETVLSALRTDTEHAINWFIENFMQINPSKCQFIQNYTSKEIKPEFIEVCGTLITCNNQVKLAEITIDDKLKLDKQVDILCKNATRQLMYYIDLRAYLI